MCLNSLTRIQLWIVAVSCGLLGISTLQMGHHRHIQLATDFYHLTPLLSGAVFNTIAAASFLVCAGWALMSLFKSTLRRPLGLALLILSIVPLLSLFSSSMWIEDLGGFPAIGSGQGVIKYFSLASIGLLLWRPQWLNDKAGKWLALFPVVLVLLWIGGMKFTELEAKGIEVLVQSSPLMAWMYSIWGVQTTSNLIGIYDLAAVVLLIAAVFYNRLLLPAVALSGAVFIVTQTFLFSWDAALSSETILTTGGHFLIKDLWYIANLVIFWYCIKAERRL
ncbi:MAG: DUF417 family protein [Aestuariibacter sp.]